MDDAKVLCWNCKGKCLLWGHATPRAAKHTWHNCPRCRGKGWLIEQKPDRPAPGSYPRGEVASLPPSTTMEQMLVDKIFEFFESHGAKIVRIDLDAKIRGREARDHGRPYE